MVQIIRAREKRSQKLSQSIANEAAKAAASSRSVYARAIVIDGPFCKRHADEPTDRGNELFRSNRTRGQVRAAKKGIYRPSLKGQKVRMMLRIEKAQPPPSGACHPRSASSPRTATTIAPRIADQRAHPTKRTTVRDRATTALLLDWLRADRRCRRYPVPRADRSRQNASSECASSKLISWQ